MMSSTCTHDGVCTNSDVAQLGGLANLPTVIRHDSLSYMKNRDGIPMELILEPIFENSENDGTEAESSCSLYMAESSIPYSGLGMYAGRDFDRGERIENLPQVVVPLIDYHEDGSILTNYPWDASNHGAVLESKSSKTLCTNLGMLANSHLGLINARQRSEDGIEILLGSIDRRSDFGTGATSLYHAASFNAEVRIERGSELFADYGEQYFHYREEQFNAIFPTHSNYKEADGIVRSFAAKLKAVTTKEDEQAWKDTVAKAQEGVGEERIRVAYALPDSVEDVKYVAEVGTARYAIPGSSRSIEWLEENAMCLDNLRMGKSDIPHSGYGAFAMKTMKNGALVSPMPMVPMTRDNLKMETENDNDTPHKSQLLLNYCFGHPDSSLLLFPYGSTANFINHSEHPNAFIRWSNSDMSKIENFERPVQDVSAGLIMEVVALEDIALGAEVTIDYGKTWTKSWDYHVETWQIGDGDPATNPAFTAKSMNEEHNGTTPIMTMNEMEEISYEYPECIRTACYSSVSNGAYVYTVPQFRVLKFCEIIDRYRKEGAYWYNARMKMEGADEHEVVTDIPQVGIKFVTGEYCNDMHLQNAFRHEIQVADGMYPDVWMDLVHDDNEDQVVDRESPLHVL